jgi:HSP20 family protein
MYRRIRVPSVWREMDQLQREMSRLVGDAVGKRSAGSPRFPAINLWTNEDGQFISSEIPGFTADDINIDVTADTLTISGERMLDNAAESAHYHRQERGFGSFTRTIQLPYMINTDSVEANFKNGVLEIKLQRAEADKPKKIVVKNK